VNVLVVDDDPIVIASCAKVLVFDGLGVRTARSVPDAIQELGRERYDLLLVDLKMPEYDGLHLMRIAREDHPDLPILVMSGFPTPETVARCAEAGASGFVPKPFTPRELLDAVQRAAGRTGRQ